MAYLAREDSLRKRKDPRELLENCQSIICLALPYQTSTTDFNRSLAGKGRVSSYAITRDYHYIVQEKLDALNAFIQKQIGESLQTKSYVDTGPILERSYASLAGLGAFGKNTCLIIQGLGSYFFLAEILTNLNLPIDAPFTYDLCKSCQRCIEACPTGCILPDRTIDAERCISYLTIENKVAIPDELKEQLGDWVFGCDVCQMVCPHNAISLADNTQLEKPILHEWIDLVELFENEPLYIEKYQHTPLSRAKRSGLLRNAAIVLGNQRCQRALPALNTALERENNPMVRDACEWAIRKISEGTDQRQLSGKNRS
jgi:epoxyqueuosine reductase